MIDYCEIDAPEVLAQVSAAFQSYEEALVRGDMDSLDRDFWSDEKTVRFGIADRQYGIAEISAWRKSQVPLRERCLSNTVVTAFGPDAAVVTTLFSYPGRDVEGRQSQMWIRFTDGWRIVSAHVSEVAVEHG